MLASVSDQNHLQDKYSSERVGSIESNFLQGLFPGLEQKDAVSSPQNVILGKQTQSTSRCTPCFLSRHPGRQRDEKKKKKKPVGTRARASTSPSLNLIALPVLDFGGIK